MELFYSDSINPSFVRLDEKESLHCVKVLRHKTGDEISVIDGCGCLFKCRLRLADPKGAEAEIIEKFEDFGAHPYSLTAAVCPTKNIERYEWFAEKACEVGVDCIVPVIGEHSERKILKSDRIERILLSAAKQSLKARVPVLKELQSVEDFILSGKDFDIKLIACCFEKEGYERKNIAQVLGVFNSGGCCSSKETKGVAPNKKESASEPRVNLPKIAVLIGPEGDFSAHELDIALQNGWIPVSLGDSRLRTETAALAAVMAVYFSF